jgi:alpha-L-rhamnosidase
LHWSPERGAFVDSVFEGQQSPVISEVANGLALLFGITSGDQQAGIVRQIADPKSPIARATPLFFYYVIEGLLAVGADELALRMLRERYAPMLAYADPPTVWESWLPYALDLNPGGPGPVRVQMCSFTHSGGVGPAWTLSKHVLGVTGSGPGLAGCRIAPVTGGLDWACGVFPSVHGDISIEWHSEGDRLLLDVDLPEGLETELALPRAAGRTQRLSHAGRTVVIPAGAGAVPGVDLSEDRVALTITGGQHHLELVTE